MDDLVLVRRWKLPVVNTLVVSTLVVAVMLFWNSWQVQRIEHQTQHPMLVLGTRNFPRLGNVLELCGELRYYNELPAYGQIQHEGFVCIRIQLQIQIRG